MSYNFKKLKLINNERLKKDLIDEIIKWDNNYFKTYDKTKYKVIKKRKRMAITEFGIISFSRRIYKNKLTNKCIAFTDLEFGLEYKKRIINDLKINIINNLGKGKRYIDIKDIFPNTYISIVTIAKILKNYNLEYKEQKLNKIKIKDNEYIYINVDDGFVPVWNINNKRELQKVRSISYNTGKKQISKNRNKLLNKKYNFIMNYKFNSQEDYYIDNPTVESTWNGLKKYYDFYNPTFVVCGDGASWIRTLAKYLGAYYVFDKYHAILYLKKAYNLEIKWKKIISNFEKINNYKIAVNYFCNGKYNELIEFLIKTKVNKETLSIFKNNKEGIINQTAKWNIGCSAESDIYHLIKSQTKSKIYNYKTLHNILIARSNYLNNRI